MSSEEQIAWCLANRATVYFGAKGGKFAGENKGVPGVSVKVGNESPTWGKTLQDAILGIERWRKTRESIHAGMQSLKAMEAETQ